MHLPGQRRTVTGVDGCAGGWVAVTLLADGQVPDSRELTGKGLSMQTWGLRGKILKADTYRRGFARPLHEVHPELSFAALAWSARRIAAGEAVTLTRPAQRADDGTEIAIRY